MSHNSDRLYINTNLFILSYSLPRRNCFDVIAHRTSIPYMSFQLHGSLPGLDQCQYQSLSHSVTLHEKCYSPRRHEILCPTAWLAAGAPGAIQNRTVCHASERIHGRRLRLQQQQPANCVSRCSIDGALFHTLQNTGRKQDAVITNYQYSTLTYRQYGYIILRDTTSVGWRITSSALQCRRSLL